MEANTLTQTMRMKKMRALAQRILTDQPLKPSQKVQEIEELEEEKAKVLFVPHA